MKKLIFLAFLSTFAKAETPNPCYWAGPTFVQCFPTGGIYLPNKRTVRLGGDEMNNSNYVEIKANENTTPSNWTLTLPADQGGLNKVLYNIDGTGELGWTDPGATVADLNAARAAISSKQATDLVCHSNVTLSGVQTCDGQSTSGAARIIAMGQTSVTENGIWLVDDFAAWNRPVDFPSSSNLPGSLVTVTEQGGGTTYQDTLWFGTGDGSSTANFRVVPTTASNTLLTASQALVTDSNNHLATSTTTATELGFVHGVTSAIQTQLNAKTTNPLTTTGDIIYASNTATPAAAARLGVGGANTLLHGGASIPAYSAVVDADVSGAIGISHGGTGQTTKAPAFDALSPMTTAGDLIYGGASGTGTRLGISGANTVLHGGASTPAYSAVADADITGQVGVAHGGTGVATLASNGVLYGNGATNVLALAVNSTATNKFLTQSSSAAPAWATIVAGDLPTSPAVVGTWDFGTGATFPTSGGTKSTLNYYEEYTATQASNPDGITWAGFTATPSSWTLNITRVGKACIAKVIWVQTAKNGSNGVLDILGIPSRFRPSAGVWNITTFNISGTFGARAHRIDATSWTFWGDAALGNVAANATAVGPNSGDYLSISYNVQ